MLLKLTSFPPIIADVRDEHGERRRPGRAGGGPTTTPAPAPYGGSRADRTTSLTAPRGRLLPMSSNTPTRGSPKDMLAVEMKVKVNADTLTLALRVWPSPRTPTLPPKSHDRVAIVYPGWLDNVGSFDTLAPLLADQLDMCMVVVDPPGCGLSSHRPAGVLYNDYDECVLIGDVADALEVPYFFLIGHSRGGGVTSTAAGLYASRCRGLIVLESEFGLVGTYTPQTQFPQKATRRYREAHANMKKNATRQPRVFPTLEDAINANVDNVMFPKTRETATNIVLRHVRPVVGGQGVTFTHDVRTYGQLQYTFLSEFSLREMLADVACPVLQVMRDMTNFKHPMGFSPSEATNKVVEDRAKVIKDLTKIIVPGDHHVHSDNAPLVAGKIVEWFEARKLADFVPPPPESGDSSGFVFGNRLKDLQKERSAQRQSAKL